MTVLAPQKNLITFETSTAVNKATVPDAVVIWLAIEHRPHERYNKIKNQVLSANSLLVITVYSDPAYL